VARTTPIFLFFFFFFFFLIKKKLPSKDILGISSLKNYLFT
jgi:hypothetical protein